ncbi:hypothetical protein C0995_006106 [Termitomyces sp. Mi166|nr:hypothetical protein C0995_006106 [Termitomyces sp. Mi166\
MKDYKREQEQEQEHSALPAIEKEEEEESNGGLCILFSEVPCFQIEGPVLIPAAFRYFFGKTLEKIKEMIVRPAMVNKELLCGKRMTINKCNLPSYLLMDGKPAPHLFDTLGRSSERKIFPHIVDNGSDVEDNNINNKSGHDLNQHVSIIWSQFLIDIPNKFLNP